MLLKLTYKYNGWPKSIATTCSNYTFGLPKIYWLFQQRYSESLQALQKKGKFLFSQLNIDTIWQ